MDSLAAAQADVDRVDDPGSEDHVIVVTFSPNGNVSVQGTPGTMQADYIAAAFLLNRYANKIADDAAAASRIVTPNRGLVLADHLGPGGARRGG